MREGKALSVVCWHKNYFLVDTCLHGRVAATGFFGSRKKFWMRSTQNFYLLSPKVNAEISAIHCAFFALQPHYCFKNKCGGGHEHRSQLQVPVSH